jgi:autotransporter-associated beta strand protein
MIETSFLRILSPSRVGRACKVGAVLLAGLPISESFAANFTWANLTGNFSDPTKWVGGTAPLGTDPTDVLTFGGDVSFELYTATHDSATNPFLINQLVFNATNPTPGFGSPQVIAGSDPTKLLLLGGVNPMIVQSGSAAITITVPIRLGGNLTLSGAGNVGAPDTNRITMDGPLSGVANITKNGTFSFRFGSDSIVPGSYSQNTWFGGLTVNDGTIRFNNNAFSAPIALRSNPVTMTSATALISTLFKQQGVDPAASLRMGTLNGTSGKIEARRETSTAGMFDSADIVITTMDSGTFAGTVDNNFLNGGKDNGRLVIRGVATQTFTGTLTLSKDVVVGRAAGMTLAGAASLAAQDAVPNLNAAVVLNGGTFTLDNTTTNITEPSSPGGRLRNGAVDSTGLETVGGGKFSLIGNAAGTSETISRLQLGSTGTTPSPRSGALTINVTSTGATGSLLTIQSYVRNAPVAPYNTVNFTANDGNAALGTPTGSRIKFGTSFPVPEFNNLLGNTGAGGSTANVGWATVNGTDFASYDPANGVFPVPIDSTPSEGSIGNPASNIAVTSNLNLSNTSGYAASSIKITPAAADQSINLASVGHLKTPGILLAGDIDFSITSTGGGGIASALSTNPRYFHVQNAVLNVSASLAGSNAAVIKSGQGLLNLTSTGNSAVTEPLVINEGTVRIAGNSSLPGGELRFRGGVLELTGGTFSRQIGGTPGTVNWSGLDTSNQPIAQEQGSGGFAAVGADSTVDLTSLLLTSDFAWEDSGFVNSGHALVFGSNRATAKVTWVDNLSLTAAGQVKNYNAREIRVVDNPSSQLDVAVLSGKISGDSHDDFLKTGAGTLIVSGLINDYKGATLVHEGAMLVNGTIATSFLANVRNNATLGGNGTIGKVKVESGGTLAPGNALGNTSVLTTGDIILSEAGAKLAIELGGTTIGGNGINGYDQIAAIGEVLLNGGTLIGTLLGGFVPTPGTLFFIVTNDGTDPVQGTFAQGSLIVINGEPFEIGYTGDSLTNAFTGGNDIVLQYIPEPTSAALFACGGIALGLMRRRRSSAR